MLGLTIMEVAHDFQAQVSKYVRNELSLQNSYDTWHGTCSILCMYIAVNADYVILISQELSVCIGHSL